MYLGLNHSPSRRLPLTRLSREFSHGRADFHFRSRRFFPSLLTATFFAISRDLAFPLVVKVLCLRKFLSQSPGSSQPLAIRPLTISLLATSHFYIILSRRKVKEVCHVDGRIFSLDSIVPLRTLRDVRSAAPGKCASDKNLHRPSDNRDTDLEGRSFHSRARD